MRAAPAAVSTTVMNGEMNEFQIKQREFLQVLCLVAIEVAFLFIEYYIQAFMDYGMECWSQMGPTNIQETLKEYADMINSPRIGSDENYMWPAVQVNVANAQLNDSGT